jgi:MazG family protein
MAFPELAHLLATLRTLRGPDGCPWDRKQDIPSAARYLCDEVHEYVDAANEGDAEAQRAELADLLYMVAFNWLLLSEQSDLKFDQLAGDGARKLIHRHPHVFGEAEAQTVEESNALWEIAKAQEKGTDDHPSQVKELSASASPLRQSTVYGDTAAEVAFDWQNTEQVFAKIHEEIAELHEAIETNDEANQVEELGDILFAVSQLARKLKIDPDVALRGTNAKFARRFRGIEQRNGHDRDAMRARGHHGLMADWEAVKKDERSDPS